MTYRKAIAHLHRGRRRCRRDRAAALTRHYRWLLELGRTPGTIPPDYWTRECPEQQTEDPACCLECHFAYEEQLAAQYFTPAEQAWLLAQHRELRRRGLRPEEVAAHARDELPLFRRRLPQRLVELLEADHERYEQGDVLSREDPRYGLVGSSGSDYTNSMVDGGLRGGLRPPQNSCGLMRRQRSGPLRHQEWARPMVGRRRRQAALRRPRSPRRAPRGSFPDLPLAKVVRIDGRERPPSVEAGEVVIAMRRDGSSRLMVCGTRQCRRLGTDV